MAYLGVDIGDTGSLAGVEALVHVGVSEVVLANHRPNCSLSGVSDWWHNWNMFWLFPQACEN